MFEIGLCSLAAFVIIAIVIGVMNEANTDKEIIYATMGVGYGGLAIGFLISALKWLFLMI
jgi:uncharacterized membrane protein